MYKQNQIWKIKNNPAPNEFYLNMFKNLINWSQNQKSLGIFYTFKYFNKLITGIIKLS